MEDTEGTLAYREPPYPSPPRTMTLRKLPSHDGNTFARRLCQVAQREIWRLDKSILIPTPISLRRSSAATAG